MSNIEIIPNQYNTICDTYGCGNMGQHVIGKPGENAGMKTIMCDECLQNIINAAPMEMILNRPELAEVEETVEDKLENMGKALEGENNPMCLDEMSFKELKEIAVDRNITVPFGTSKDKLVELLEGIN